MQQPQQQQQQTTVVAGVPMQGYSVQQPYPTYQQHVYTQQQPVVLVQPHPRSSGVRDQYPSKVGMVFGVLLLIGGALCIIFNIVGIAIDAEASSTGHGIWVGISFLITGALTVSASKSKVSGLIVGSMVMACLSAIFSLVVISSAAIGLALDQQHVRYHDGYGTYIYWYEKKDHYDACIAVNGILIALGLLCGLLCIAISVVDCVGLCSGQSSPGHVIVPQQQSHMIVTSQQQQGGVTNSGMQYPMQSFQPQPVVGYGAPNPPPYAQQATSDGYTPQQPGQGPPDKLY